MRLETEAIVVAVRPHGEHGAIVRLLTPKDGLRAGYVRGGRSRRLRPVLVPGNIVAAELRARTQEQLAHANVELVRSRAFLLGEPLPAAGLEWACALAAACLAEEHPYPRVHSGLEALLAAIESADRARGWATALVRYELILLAELGFGLNGEEMAVMPAALIEGREPAGWDEVAAGLLVTGRRVESDLLTGWRASLMAARERLIERLKRVGG